QLERQVSTGVRADLTSVQPYGGAVVDRLEPNEPVLVGRPHAAGERAAWKREVLSVPADPPIHACGREIIGVIGVGHADRGPPLGGGATPPEAVRDSHVAQICAIQPLAPEQVATTLTISVKGALAGRLGWIRGTLGH